MAAVAANPLTEVYRPITPPAGAIEFAPRKAIPLPAPGAGDVIVFSFPVPLGYDGFLLGQFNSYTGAGFLDGSGDLVWRVAANLTLNLARYVRDCGNILVQLGTPKLFQTIPGGHLVRSGNTCSYIVAAPNITGSLPAPGTGMIICGLRGYFFPRK
jgi:hypothetical protein